MGEYFEHVLPFDRTEPVWRQSLLSTPPLRDQHGRRVVLVRAGIWNPQTVDFRQFSPSSHWSPRLRSPASPSSSTAPASGTSTSKTSASMTSRSSPYLHSKGFPCGSARFTSAALRGSFKCFSPF